MKNNSLKKRWADALLTCLIVLGSWGLLTLFFSPMVVPTIGSVFKKIVGIVTTPKLSRMIVITTGRLFTGLAVGIGVGSILGILMGHFARFRRVVSPLIGILQTVPPVSWVILALVWFGFNGRPTVFIVVTATLPIIAINTSQGIRCIDDRLLEMAELYRFSWKKKIRHIVLPSIAPYFRSALQLALGLGWKIAVMGEVLTTSDGIGGMIKTARLNIEPEAIIAWSIIMVGLFYFTDAIVTRAFSGETFGKRRLS